jgi:hypothetical protein
LLGVVVPEGGGELNERDGAGADGVDGLGVGFGDENDRDGDLGAEDFGAENERLPELNPLEPAASAGAARTPSMNTRVTARASKRLAAAQGRIIPLPRRFFANAGFPCQSGYSCSKHPD